MRRGDSSETIASLETGYIYMYTCSQMDWIGCSEISHNKQTNKQSVSEHFLHLEYAG